jgi:hypothetical protein
VTDLCFIDTETTSLRRDRRAWEVGIIRRSADGIETEHQWFIDANEMNFSRADLMSLKIGRFYDRHPQAAQSGDLRRRTLEMPVTGEADALWEIEALTRGAHLVGAVVSFDAEVLAARMAAHDICPSWHYHLIDVEALAVGYLAHAAAVCERRGHDEIPGPAKEAELRELASPPWKSDDLSASLGISVSDEDRHTALGDARWAMAIYDAVMAR